MTQIELSFSGILQYFANAGAPPEPPLSDAGLRNKFITTVLAPYSKQPASYFKGIHGDVTLIEDGAVIVFLLRSGIATADELKKDCVDGHRNGLIVNNHQHTGIPIWRLQALSNTNLVQMALLWYTKIDFTLQGLLPLFGVSPDQIKDPASWDTVKNLLSQYSSEPKTNFDKRPFAVLLGKLGIIAFLLRWKYTQDALKVLSTTQQRRILADENYARTGIAYQFLSGESAGRNYQRFAPFSDKDLVDLALAWYVIDKPYVQYNDVSWVTTHDSFTGDKKYLGFEASRDQNRNIDEQLASGVRAVRISADPDGELVHGHLKGGTKATDFGSLKGYLTRMKNFLDANRNEIVTIIDESGDPDSLAKTYTDILSDYLFAPKTDGDKMPDNWPKLSDLLNGNWPTIRDMVTQNKRVVVMQSNDYDTAYPWRLHSYDGTDRNFFISMDLDNYGLSGDYHYRPAFSTAKSPKTQRWNDNNHLYLINHYLYKQYMGQDSSSRAYSRSWGNGELVIEYAMLAWQQTTRKPNFIHVDFYDLPNVFNNFLFDLAAALNRPDAYGPFEVPYMIDARKPVMITSTIQENAALRLGQIYTITCVAAKDDQDDNPTFYNLRRAADADGAAVTLVPANASDVNQHWKIVYNTPATGFALATPDESFALYDPNWNDPDRNVKQSNNALILKTLLGNQQGTGFGIQGDGGSIYLYKSNMFVGDNTENLNEFNQELSLWQVLGAGSRLENNFNVGRWEIDGDTDNNNNQRWNFTPVVANPAPSRWTEYANTGAINGNSIGQLPDDNGWTDEPLPLLDQVEAYAGANQELTYFSFDGQNIQLYNDLNAWLGSALQGENTYVMNGYTET